MPHAVRRWPMLAAVALISMLALAPSAHAAVKPFSVVLSSPASFPAGPATIRRGTDEHDPGDVHEPHGQQQLGSSDLAAPAGLTIVSAPAPAPGTVTVSSNTARIRNLSLAPGASSDRDPDGDRGARLRDVEPRLADAGHQAVQRLQRAAREQPHVRRRLQRPAHDGHRQHLHPALRRRAGGRRHGPDDHVDAVRHVGTARRRRGRRRRRPADHELVGADHPRHRRQPGLRVALGHRRRSRPPPGSPGSRIRRSRVPASATP